MKRTDSRWINAYHSCSMVIKSCPLLMKDTETCVGSSLASYFVLFSLISFCFRWFRFISFSFRWFRFVSFLLISFRFVFVRFVSFLFRFALYKYPDFTPKNDIFSNFRGAHAGSAPVLWCLIPLSTIFMSWWWVLLVEKTRKNHRPVSHWQTVSSLAMSGTRTHNCCVYRHWLHM